MRRIKVEVDGASAMGDLEDIASPATAEAFWQTLPIETMVWQDGWSGLAAVFAPGGTALASAPDAEAIVCSIYQGTLLIAPRGEKAFLAYGVAEYRDETGTLYGARVARMREGWPDLRRKLAALVDDGQKRIRITRA